MLPVIKSNQIYLPTQNMKEKKTDEKTEVNQQNEKNNNKLEVWANAQRYGRPAEYR